MRRVLIVIIFAWAVLAAHSGPANGIEKDAEERELSSRQFSFFFNLITGIVNAISSFFGGSSISPTTTTSTTLRTTTPTPSTTSTTRTTSTTNSTTTPATTTKSTTSTTTPTTTTSTATTPTTTTSTTTTPTTTTPTTTTPTTTTSTTTTPTTTTSTTTTPTTTTPTTTTPTTTTPTTTTPTTTTPTTTTTTTTTSTTTTPTTTTSTTTTPTTTTSTTTTPTTTSNPCNCGVTTRSTLRVVGGTTATSATEFPWQVVILPNVNQNILCGGALIDASWVLTAASCMYSAKTATIRAGVIDSTDSSSATYQMRNGTVTLHVNFTAGIGYRNNDLALIKTDTPFSSSSTVNTICMPIKEENLSFLGRTTNLAGWGLNSASNKILNSATFTVLDANDTRCPLVGFPFRTFCLNTSATQGPCTSGDGGSPVTWLDTTVRRAKLVGLLSEGVSSCGSTSANPFVRVTRVSRYLPWITNITGLSFCIP